MAEPLTYTAACTAKDCPQPANPDWHYCLHCGDDHIEHHHAVNRSQGGGKETVVPVCHKIHQGVHDRKLVNWIADGIYHVTDAQGKPLGSWDVATGTGWAEPAENAPDLDVQTVAFPLPGEITETSWTPPSTMTTVADFEACFRALGAMKKCTPFWVGDAVIAAEAVLGEAYPQAVAASGLKEQTVMNYASVCRRVPPHLRRAELDMGHHAAVMKLDEQGQEEWLEVAAAGTWTVAVLRRAIRGTRECETHDWVSLRKCATCGEIEEG